MGTLREFDPIQLGLFLAAGGLLVAAYAATRHTRSSRRWTMHAFWLVLMPVAALTFGWVTLQFSGRHVALIITGTLGLALIVSEAIIRLLSDRRGTLVGERSEGIADTQGGLAS